MSFWHCGIILVSNSRGDRSLNSANSMKQFRENSNASVTSKLNKASQFFQQIHLELSLHESPLTEGSFLFKEIGLHLSATSFEIAIITDVNEMLSIVN